MKTDHIAETARVTHDAFARLMRGESDLYLWYRPGELVVAQDKPEGAELAFPERIPEHLDRERLGAWFTARTGRVPYLLP
jgi:hypothetical protein